MNRSETALLFIDVQAKLFPKMVASRRASLETNAVVLLKMAARLGVKTVWTEQYPRGLGPTIPDFVPHLEAAGAKAIEKMSFSVAGSDETMRALEGKKHAVLVGIEAHICVYLSAFDLRAKGLDVTVVADAVASRTDENALLGLELSRQAGARVAPTETVLFHLLREAGTDEFRELSKLIR